MNRVRKKVDEIEELDDTGIRVPCTLEWSTPRLLIYLTNSLKSLQVQWDYIAI